MKLEPQFEQFLIRDLWGQVRENFKRDGYLAHVGIFLTDQAEPEIALLDKMPKMMIGWYLQLVSEQLKASVVITISEGWINQLSPKSKRVKAVMINVQTEIGVMESCTPITYPELPELFEPFADTSESKDIVWQL